MTTVRVIRGRSRDIGFTVRRLLPTLDVPAVGPFVFLDHMGPARFPDDSREGDVRPHPHIGLATVTYLYDGAFEHRDSLGVFQRIEPGAVNLMTAGRGVVHSERIPADVRRDQMVVEGIQMWLALPQALERCEPAFQHYPVSSLPLSAQGPLALRVLIGTVNGLTSPVTVPSTTVYADLLLQDAGSWELQVAYAERALYVAQGQLQLNGETVSAGELAVLSADAPVQIACRAPARAMLLGGAPLDGKRFLWWNFVASDKALIEQAKRDWQQQQLGTIPGEHEFIPLPER